jgi:hypothetical protein
MQVSNKVIRVDYKSTNEAAIAASWITELPDIFAADLETAVKYPAEVVTSAKEKMVNPKVSRKLQVKYQAIANATALGHPSHCTITHCSIAWTNKDALVFIIDNQAIADVVLDFLTETDKTQIWHNYCYDGRFIRYFTGKDVRVVEDTQIFAKTLLNHVNIYKAITRLKDLMEGCYGSWGISSDSFTIAQQHSPEVIKYSAIDACATYKLWEDLNDFIEEADSGKTKTVQPRAV